jgi:hypothetical protein
MRDALKSGVLGVGPAILAKNPDLLRGFGVVGNVMAEDIEDRDEEKKRQQAGMKKGGKVSSASKRADGCAVRGKTKGKMV